MARRSPKWTRDELILALDLYFRVSPLHTTEKNPAIRELSRFLNQLPIHTTRQDTERFRNPNAVYMKLCNFLRLDPEYSGKGLSRGSKLEEAVWREFASDPARLAGTAWAIRTSSKTFPSATESLDEIDEEEEFVEGKILTRLHRLRERNQTAVENKKLSVLASAGVLVCEACGFDFHAAYGNIGYGFAECHHIIPLSDLHHGVKTKLSDLAVVCSNCHRMLHKTRPWMTTDQLRKLVSSRRRSEQP
jgi:5-methylcytosine-specific restriction protein A